MQFGHCNVTNCILYMTISMEYNYRQYSNVHYAIYIMQYATCIYAICSIQYCNMKCAMSTLQCEMLTLPILQCLISAHVNLNMSFCTNSFDVVSIVILEADFGQHGILLNSFCCTLQCDKRQH